MLSWLCVHCNRGRLRSVRHCLVSHQCRCVLQRQPFVPLHRATALCGCLYASLHNGFVWLTLCILAYRLFATTCKHPCLKPLGTHAKASLPLYERSVGFASCKAFGRSFQASLPCLLLPLHRTFPFPQPLQKDNNPLPRTMFLPPLSKGGGLTARHKLLLCCVLLATRPPFLFTKLFCRQDGGIVTPPTFPKPHYPTHFS